MDNKVNYTKQAKSIQELVKQLADRGMFIQDVNYAETVLSRINYYRLSGYWFPFQNKIMKKEAIPEGISEEERDILENKFVSRITFQNVVDIYRFDTKLRSLCFDALEKIEIAINTLICEHMCNKYGGFWFEDENNVHIRWNRVKGESKITFSAEVLKVRLEKLLEENNRTQCIKHFSDKYVNKFPPYWILSQIITFGLLSQIYASLKNEDRKEIAARLGVPDTFLMEALRALSYVRNICAHYGRLWNRYLVIPPPAVSFKSSGKYKQIGSSNLKRFYDVFYLISFFLIKIAPDSKWCNLVSRLIARYAEKTMLNSFKNESLISFEKMGFPLEWENYPLFEDLLRNE